MVWVSGLRLCVEEHSLVEKYKSPEHYGGPLTTRRDGSTNGIGTIEDAFGMRQQLNSGQRGTLLNVKHSVSPTPGSDSPGTRPQEAIPWHGWASNFSIEATSLGPVK